MMVVGTFLWDAFGGSVSTLCSQAHGAQNHRLVGIWIQIATFVASIACIPVAVLWVFTSASVELLGFHKDALLAGTYARWSIIGIWPNTMFVLYNNYYQVRASAVLLACCCPKC